MNMKYGLVLICALVVMAAIGAYLIFGTSSDDTNSLAEKIAEKTLTEKEKYANFEAEFVCQLLGVEDPADVVKIMEGFEEFSNQHEYTSEEVTALVEKYKNDSEFKTMVLEEMKSQCPDKVEKAGFNNDSIKIV